MLDRGMDTPGSVCKRKSTKHRVLLLLVLVVIKASIACDAPLPKPMHVEECDCHHNGTDVSMTCYSDVDCYNASDTTYIYKASWPGYFDNGTKHMLSNDMRYQSDTRTEIRGKIMTRFMATLTISNVTDVDYVREFKFYVDSEYEGMKQLPPIRLLCNKTEVIIVDVGEPSDYTMMVVGVLVAIVVCGMCVLCAVVNLPFLKYLLLRCCGRELLHKRIDTDGLAYDTALVYDTDDTKALIIAASLKKKLTSDGYDVASADDVHGGQGQLQELELIPTSATVIFIVTQASTVDILLTLARDAATTCKTPKEQILVHADHVPSEFKQYKLLTLNWFEDVRQRKSSGTPEHYRVVSTVDTNRESENEPNGHSSEIIRNSDFSGKRKDNVCFISRVYRGWKRRRFYKALRLRLSTGFRVNKDADTSLSYNAPEISLTELQGNHQDC